MTESWPLSQGQLGVWRAERLNPHCSFAIAECFELNGPLDVPLLERAISQVVAETGALHLTFADRGGVPVQRVDPAHRIPLPVLDLRREHDPRSAAEAWMRADFAAARAGGTAEFSAQALILVGDTGVLWYLRSHHLAIDGYSFYIILKRVADTYRRWRDGTPGCLPELNSPRALAAAEDRYRSSARYSRDRAYWTTRLAQRPPVVTLTDVPAPRTSHVRRHVVTFSPADADALRAGADRSATSLPRLAIAALAVYLHRLSGTAESLIGLPVTGRLTPQSVRTPGMVANAVSLRLTVRPAARVADLLRQVDTETAAAGMHQRYRFEQLRHDLALSETEPLYGPMLNVMQLNPSLLFDDVHVTSHNISTGPVEDMSIALYDRTHGNDLRIDVNANADRYTDAALQTHARGIVHCLQVLAHADPDSHVGRLDLTHPADRQQTLTWGRPSHHTTPSTWPRLFAAQVRRTPTAVAVRHRKQQLTFAELDARTDQLAHQLRQWGAGPEHVVAVALPRSFDLIVATVAVLKSGSAYLPVDPAYPDTRIALMLADASPALTLATADTRTRLPAAQSGVVCVDTEQIRAAVAAQPAEPLLAAAAVPGETDHPAYVIYTSGSTGTPKGVVVTHAGITGLVESQQRLVAPGPGSSVLQFAAASFDAAFWEMCMALLTGATLVLADQADLLPGPPLAALIARERPTHVTLPPTSLAELAADALDGVECLVVAGERCPGELVHRWATRRRMINAYGPTEATVCATATWALNAGADPSIGRPVANTTAYVLDSCLRPTPVGVTGELYLAGPGLARGYLRRPALTAARFVADPFEGGGTVMYRTGDLARWRAGGELEFTGRADEQIKLRGFRIEPGEIESAIHRHADVRQAVVAVRGAAADHLVAYLVPAGPGGVDTQRLAADLAAELPAHLVPAAYLQLDELPTTPNGKLDRARLPDPRPQNRPGPARTSAEEVLCGIFTDVLGEDRPIGADDDFFAAGGHSLLAARLVGRIRRVFGVNLPVAELFENPTPARLARRLDRGADRPPVRAMPRPESIPLSPAQHRLWFLGRLDGAVAYHVPFAAQLDGPLDIAALRAALGDVVDRHESLRTLFPEADGEPVQRILAPGSAQPPVTVLDCAPADVSARLTAAARQPFELAQELPVRVTLLRVHPTRHVVAVVLHHIAGDGWSAAPFVRDLNTAYAARRAGSP
ncbi:MAG: hypothetical protein QOI74_4132, partial [Micromonosporaceae bacterium]|nr:hypothetical protein [Micromonosporaceae bacterium]